MVPYDRNDAAGYNGACSGIHQDSVLQIIVLPKHGTVEDVVVARVYMATLPFVIQMALEANCVASGVFDERDPELVVPADIVTISSDLHAWVMKDILARDEIMDPGQESLEADSAVSMFGMAWRELFFSDQTKQLLSNRSISRCCDSPSLTIRVETPYQREAMQVVW